MSFAMHLTNEFQKALNACNSYRQQIQGDTEFLIYRLNSSNRSMGNLFSMAHQTPMRTGFGGIKEAVKGKAKNNRITRPHRHQGGGHAEEIFLRSMHKFESVSKVEMFISLIPCDRSSAMQINLDNEDVFVPSGCGAKLKFLAERYPNISWEICYERIYDGNTGQRTHQYMIKLSTFHNANVYRYNAGSISSISSPV
ncbi:hypothetical protein [Microbulbifer celer]|uniref:Uncharacterized protein n=1 Tax=Microbulbifer celer TaxID=435905 RepID=A0ABW3UBJ4_9GAMM|nr:hypothetical protein [Microbulbifer celer]UFN58896.1 hypothetical protein LPW13_07610 [Microbulbifer celer]